jgi:hypothetical protein
MAHQIDTTSRATASYASTQREWHGLGELMPAGQTVEQWQKAAGMDYQIKRQAKQFWDFLAALQQVRSGVQDARHQSAE